MIKMHGPLPAPLHPALPTRPRPRTLTVHAQKSPARELLDALWTHTRREVVNGWASDLVVPLFSDSHGSDLGLPTGTVPPTNLADPDSKFVEVDGITIHYKECRGTEPSGESPSQPTVLLLHGFNGSVFNWRYAMAAVHAATGLRVVAFDRPPFGLSQRPTEWGEGMAVKFNPYETEGSARITQGML